MSTLYELTAEYLQLLEWAEDPDIDPQVIDDTMECLSGDIEDKADAYARVIAQMEYDAAAIKAEYDRLALRKKRIDNSIDRMKNSLKTAMILTNKTKFKTDLFSFNIQKNPPKVVIDQEDVFSIPEEYLEYQLPVVNKQKIKDDLKAGKDLEGIAHLEQTEGLRIK